MTETRGAYGGSGGFEIPAIELGFDESTVADSVIAGLAAAGGVYDFAGRLADVVHDSGTATVRKLSAALLRERITGCCRLYTESIDPNFGTIRRKFVRPPGWLVDAISDRGNWAGVPVLRGIVRAPLLRPDGTIAQRPGFDTRTGLFADLPEDFPPVPETPTAAETEIALARLFEVVADFPWKSTAAFSAWLAALLTVVGRESFEGPAPLFLVTANTRGSGKSLLCDVISEIACGHAAPRMTYSADDTELSKQVLSIADAAERLVLFDNLSGKIGGATLDAALTSEIWRGRILGKTEIVTRPLKTVFLATGNNAVLHADTARRVIPVTLHTNLEHPEDRNDFARRDLLSHVRANRAELLTAALVLLRRFVASGRPSQGLRPLGSYSGWGDLIRNAIVFCDMPDPCEGRAELVESADSEAVALRALLAALWEIDEHSKGTKTSDLLQIVQGQSFGIPTDAAESLRGAAESLCDVSAERLNARRLGIRLGHFRGRVAGGLALESRVVRGSTLWLAVPCGERGSEPQPNTESALKPQEPSGGAESQPDLSWAEAAFA